jgi:hypothetical protein
MHVPVSKSLPAFLAIASLGFAACDGTSVTAGNPAAPGLATSALVLVTAEPATIHPEFLSSPFCGTHRPFRGRVDVTVRADHDRFLRSMRFEFRDRFGGQLFPTAVPIPSAATIPSLTPVPIPTSSPIPIPGHVPFGGTLVSSGSSRTQSFLLHFGCGFAAVGTLFVDVETTDRFDSISVSQARVRVGG